MKTRDAYWKRLRLGVIALMRLEMDDTPDLVKFVGVYGKVWREHRYSSLTGLEITGMNGDMCRHITRGWVIPESWEDAAKAAQEDREACARKCGVLPPDPWY